MTTSRLVSPAARALREVTVYARDLADLSPSSNTDPLVAYFPGRALDLRQGADWREVLDVVTNVDEYLARRFPSLDSAEREQDTMIVSLLIELWGDRVASQFLKYLNPAKDGDLWVAVQFVREEEWPEGDEDLPSDWLFLRQFEPVRILVREQPEQPEPASAPDALTSFLGQAGIDPWEAETLIRLAATVADDRDLDAALASFSNPTDVEALAKRAASRLYATVDAQAHR